MAYVGGRQESLTPELVEIITDELNVKEFEFVEEAGKLVDYRVLPDNKLLGPGLGRSSRKSAPRLQRLDPAMVAARVQAGQPFHSR